MTTHASRRAHHPCRGTDLGPRVALIADVHGHLQELRAALEACCEAGVTTVALLGDLFDRAEQADACASALAGWHVVGVYGNHEREVAMDAALGLTGLAEATVALLTSLQEEVLVGDVCFAHEVERWGLHDPLARLFSRGHSGEPHPHGQSHARITFTGHTHHRLARDERGTLDIARGILALDRARRYLINPGALLIGQYAIWDREEEVVYFRNVVRGA